MNMSEIIVNVSGNVILTIATLLMVKILSKEHIEIKNYDGIISFILVIFLESVSYQYLEDIFKSLFIITIMFALIKIIFNVSYSKAIILTIITQIILIISDTLGMIFIVRIMNIPINIYIGSIITNLLISILSIIIAKLFKEQLRNCISIKITSDKLIIIFSILVFICISIIFYYGFKGGKVSIEATTSIAIMAIFMSVLYLLIKERINNSKLEAEYDTLISAMEDFEEELDKQSTIHHENKNQLLSIKSKIIDNESNVKVIKYIDSVLKDEIEFNQRKYARFKNLPSNGIKGLFYFKASKAEKQNISIKVDISKDIKNSIIYNLNVENYKQLGRLLGVYLDNAVEASYNSEDKLLGIEVNMSDNDVNIIISNTYDDTIDLSKIGINRFTTKGKRRGYGLSLASKIINSNEIFIEEKEITTKLYIQKLIIKKSI